MKKIAGFSIFLFVAICSSLVVFGQDDKKVLGEVTVVANDATYINLRGLSSSAGAFTGDYATVANVVLTKDAATFTLKSGEIYFLTSASGKTVGAIFMGSGDVSLIPPVPSEKKHIAIFTDSPELNDTFDTLTMFFTDTTLDLIKAAPGVQMGKGGPQAKKAQTIYIEREGMLRGRFRYNMSARILADIYAPQRPGMFATFIDGGKFGRLFYAIDPLGQASVYPEQVQLLSLSDTTGGIWTAFHMANEYKKGTATSWTDRRSFDIKKHTIDATIEGTRLIVKDEVTIEMLEANSRFLPFDLFQNLRVKSVKDEAGSAVVFIQENKDADADLGVILPAAQEKGKVFKLTFEYEGTGAILQAGPGNFILGPRSTWYPNNPATSFGDRAAFDINFRYPKKWVMVGVGSKMGDDTVEGDSKLSKWSSEGVELAVAGFNYGDFKMSQTKDPTTGLNLEVFNNNLLPDEMRDLQARIDQAESQGARTGTTLRSLSTASGAKDILNEALNATRLYSAYFGKVPYKRIAMTQQPATGFGQAWPTLVFMPYASFFTETDRVQIFGMRGGVDGFWREVAAHEVAHQWWGHLVGWTSYRDQWMSEGFAEFSTSLYILYVKQNPAKFTEFWEDQRTRIIQSSPATKGRKPYTIGPVSQGYRLSSAKTGSAYQSLAYPKGAYILHMIRMMMFDHRGGTGDVRFQKMMLDFIKTNYNKDISTNDFKLAVERHMLPEMDIDNNKKMDWFFDQWVYGADVPSYKLQYSVKSNGGKNGLSGKITQSGVSDNFAMLVPIYVDYGKGPLFLGTVTMVGNSSIDFNDIPLPAQPTKVTLAAINDVLAEKIEIVK
ncbi:MAG TPA: M1 family aminopeptidase [Pyrinomonadaceae bacterium]|nr:M1 family aminopeptidase [Pyrinomonadaceae bacterium]